MKNRIAYLLITTMTCLLLSCTNTDDEDPYAGFEANLLFKQAETALAKGNYNSAVKMLQSFEAQYPFSQYSERVLRDLIFAHYKADDHIMAVAAADRYLRMYPRSRHADYVYYLKGVANYEKELSFFDKIFPVDYSLRDTSPGLKAYKDFSALVENFPKSKYAPESRRRMNFLIDMFARNELHAAKYYYRKKAYVAAANRASYIIQYYSKSASVAEALAISYAANRALGMTRASKNALRVFKMNYPKSNLLKQYS